jgi:hypothetical protein
MRLSSILLIGVTLGVMSASLIILWQTVSDPKNKKQYFYAKGLVHKWVWMWALLLMLGLILWAADVISGYWVWMLFAALVAFLIWAFVLNIFRPVIAGIVIWGTKEVAKL